MYAILHHTLQSRFHIQTVNVCVINLGFALVFIKRLGVFDETRLLVYDILHEPHSPMNLYCYFQTGNDCMLNEQVLFKLDRN